MEATLSDKMDLEKWNELCLDVIRLLKTGNKNWEINLLDLSDCSSPELDILVEMNAIIKRHAGNICFKVKEDSNINGLLKLKSLDKLFTIVQTQPGRV